MVSKINNFTNKLLTHVSKWLVRQILVSKIDNSLARAPDLTMTLLSLKCVSNLKSIFYLNPQWRRSQRYTRFHENGSFTVHSSSTPQWRRSQRYTWFHENGSFTVHSSSTPQWRRSQRYTWFHENGSFTLHSSSNPQNKTSCSLQTENLASALLTLKAFLFTKIAYFFNQFFGFFDPTMTLLTPQL